MHSWEDSLSRNQGVTVLALLSLDGLPVYSAPQLLFEIGVRVKGPYGANADSPGGKGERASMRLVDRLPGLEFREFRIEDQTVKIKNDGAYHMVLSKSEVSRMAAAPRRR